MYKKLAKIKYLPNNFEVIENGDYVICSVSGKKISLNELTYWNVELQEAYFSYIEASKKKEIKLLPPVVCPNPLFWISSNHLLKYFIQFMSNYLYFFIF